MFQAAEVRRDKVIPCDGQHGAVLFDGVPTGSLYVDCATRGNRQGANPVRRGEGCRQEDQISWKQLPRAKAGSPDAYPHAPNLVSRDR